MKSSFWFLLVSVLFGAAVAAEPVHALREAGREVRIAQADVTATVSVLGGAAVTRRLEPMTVADQPSFGGFFMLGMSGLYKLRFEARRPGVPQVASAEIEYRVSPEARP